MNRIKPNRFLTSILKLLCLTLLLTVSSFFGMKEAMATTLDEIQNYTIIIDPRLDGTLDMTYHIEWKVLNDSAEGPLSWVNIGIPNQHVDSITALSNTINAIDYSSYQGGSYVRIDFDRSYYKDEIVSFDFSIHQSYMYQIDQSKHQCSYTFVPGWFDEIEVKQITVYWNQKDVLITPSDSIENGYYVVSDTLSKGEKLSITVAYSLDSFQLNTDTSQSSSQSGSQSNSISSKSNSQSGPKSSSQTSSYSDDGGGGFLIFIIIIAFIVLFVINQDNYNNHSGFGPHGRHHGPRPPIHHSSCVHSSCACACACACAGGGRAGCSKKDFYRTNLTKDKFDHAIH